MTTTRTTNPEPVPHEGAKSAPAPTAARVICVQCGAVLREVEKSRPTKLCDDCAFEDIGCTD